MTAVILQALLDVAAALALGDLLHEVAHQIESLVLRDCWKGGRFLLLSEKRKGKVHDSHINSHCCTVVSYSLQVSSHVLLLAPGLVLQFQPWSIFFHCNKKDMNL